MGLLALTVLNAHVPMSNASSSVIAKGSLAVHVFFIRFIRVSVLFIVIYFLHI